MPMTLAITLALSSALPCAPPEPSATGPSGPPSGPEWSVEGRWLDTCDCGLPCPCWHGDKPAKKHCQDLWFFHVDKGHFGPTRLDGLDLVQVYASADGMSMIESGARQAYQFVAYYLSEKTPPAVQTAALEIFGRLALAPLAATRRFTINKVALEARVAENRIELSIPRTLSVAIEELKDAHGAPLAYPEDTTVLGFVDRGTAGKQLRVDYDGEGAHWRLKGGNATLAKFAWSSARGALPMETP
jgi:hypothetical protein